MTNGADAGEESAAPTPEAAPKRGVRRLVKALAMLVALVVMGLEVDRHLRAAGALTRFGDAASATGVTAWVAGYRVTDVTVQESVVAGRPMRTYLPAGPSGAQLVLAHGMHPMGFDEPRLVALARAFAARHLAPTASAVGAQLT